MKSATIAACVVMLFVGSLALAQDGEREIKKEMSRVALQVAAAAAVESEGQQFSIMPLGVQELLFDIYQGVDEKGKGEFNAAGFSVFKEKDSLVSYFQENKALPKYRQVTMVLSEPRLRQNFSKLFDYSFQTSFDAAEIRRINKEIENGTGFSNVISSSYADRLKLLGLVSSSMEADWMFDFKKEGNKRQFATANGKETRIQYMTGFAPVSEGTMDGLNCYLVNMAQENMIVLPTADPVKTLEKLAGGSLKLLVEESMQRQLVIPQFSIETTVKWDKACREMRISTPFSSSADLSNMVVNGKDFYIDKIESKTRATLDEKGFSAEQIALVTVLAKSISLNKPLEDGAVVIDKPFLLFVLNKNGEIASVSWFNGEQDNDK